MPEPVIPRHRRQPKDHLKSAAQSSLGSQEEVYGIQAAIAETLLDIADELRAIRIAVQTNNTPTD